MFVVLPWWNKMDLFLEHKLESSPRFEDVHNIFYLYFWGESHVMVKKLAKLHHHQGKIVLRYVKIRMKKVADFSHIGQLFRAFRDCISLPRIIRRLKSSIVCLRETSLWLISAVIIFGTEESFHDGVRGPQIWTLEIVADSSDSSVGIF